MKQNTSSSFSKIAGKTLLSALIAMGINSYANASSLQAQIISFEEVAQPTWITANNSQLSQIRAIHGNQSILWQWQQGETLTLDHTFNRMTDSEATTAYGRAATQVLSFWIYNPVAIDDTMSVVLSDASGLEPTNLSINLNFSGWRTIGVSLNADFPVVVTNNLAKLTFHAPSSSKTTSGSFYIDRVMVSVDDNRYQWSDDQVTTRYTVPEIDFGLPTSLPVPTQAELDDAETIKQTLITEYTYGTKYLSDLQTRFNALGISKDHLGNISGRHILTAYQAVIYQPKHLLPADKAGFDNYVWLSDYTELMLDISQAYHQPAFIADRQQLADMYLLMTEHLLDQGFADGSGLVTTHHWGYGARWWYISALMMADELTAKGLLDPTYRALLWYSREFKDSFDMALNSQSSNLDYFNTLSSQHLVLLLLNPNNSERIALLRKFSSFFSGALSQTPPGYNDGFRFDGTAWRHRGHYPGYAFPAFKRAAHVAYMLKGTYFSLNNEALDSLKNVMVAGWLYTNPYVPVALSGRHPFTGPGIKQYTSGLKWLANSYSSVNEELAAIYLQATNTSEAQSSSHFGKSITPATLPEGSWSFNGGAFVIHRHGDRMATIKGYNKEVWSSEIYYQDNRYGRYQSHGSVHVVPYGEPTDFGYSQEGWDWNRNPGATTIHLDYAQLESPNTHSLMLYSDEGISGSTSLKEQFSLFTFKHKAPQKLNNFEPTFVAEKHVLAAGDKLFLTGNGITNADGGNRTETTLFQLAIGSTPKGVWLNGIHHNEAVFSATLSSGDWLIDDNGVGYYLIEADTVHVRRGSQNSHHNKTKAPTSGEFSSAWIDHGLAPNNASYQYVMMMNTTPAEMAAFADSMKSSPQFTVLERSDNDQVLFDRINQLYGYSSTASATFSQGPVKTVSTTAQVLMQLSDSDAYLSIASPELNLQKNDLPTLPVTIEVEVAGEWELSGAAYSYHNGNTRITVDSLFGHSVNLTLSQKKAPITDGENTSSGENTNSGESSGNNANNSNNEDISSNVPSTVANTDSNGASASSFILVLLGLIGWRRRRVS